MLGAGVDGRGACWRAGQPAPRGAGLGRQARGEPGHPREEAVRLGALRRQAGGRQLRGRSRGGGAPPDASWPQGGRAGGAGTATTQPDKPAPTLPWSQPPPLALLHLLALRNPRHVPLPTSSSAASPSCCLSAARSRPSRCTHAAGHHRPVPVWQVPAAQVHLLSDADAQRRRAGACTGHGAVVAAGCRGCHQVQTRSADEPVRARVMVRWWRRAVGATARCRRAARVSR